MILSFPRDREMVIFTHHKTDAIDFDLLCFPIANVAFGVGYSTIKGENLFTLAGAQDKK
jgi:hypothetical protein